MSRKRIESISKSERYKIVGNFFDLVSEMRTKKELVGFFVGLLSPSETIMLARRIQIAELILEGKKYSEISSIMKVSESTIASVARWLDVENSQFRKQIKHHQKMQKKKGVKRTKSYYSRIMSPYGQLSIVKDLFNL